MSTCVATGCDSSDLAETPEIAAIQIAPDSARIAVGEQVDFSVAALTAEGDTIRDVSFQWASTDPAVFTVQETGVATGQAAGTAYCRVGVPSDASGTTTQSKASKRIFVGRDSAYVAVF